MATENIIINFSANTESLKATNDLLVQTGQITQKDSEKFKELNASSQKTVNELKTPLTQLNQQLKETGTQVAKAFIVDGTNNIAKAATSFQSLRSQLKAAVNDAAQLGIQFGQLSPQAVAAREKAAGLRNEIQTLQKGIEALDPQAKFTAFAQVIGGTIGAFQGLTGAIQLFGGESKEAEEIAKKLQGALNVAQGLNSILQLGDAFKALRSVLGLTTTATVAQEVAQGGLAATTTTEAAATTGATVATKGFTAALLSNPITIVIAAVAALAAAIIILADDTDEAAIAVDNLNDEFIGLDGTIKAFDRNRSNYEKTLSNQIALLKAKGATEKEIAEAEEQANKTRINLLNNEQSLLSNGLKTLDEERAKILSNSELDEGQRKKALDDIASRQAQFQSRLKQIPSDIKNINDEIAIVNAQFATDEGKKRKEELDKAKKKREQEAKKAADDKKKAGEDLIKLEDDINQKSREQLAESEAAKLEILKQAAIEQLNITARKAGVDPDSDPAALKARADLIAGFDKQISDAKIKANEEAFKKHSETIDLETKLQDDAREEEEKENEERQQRVLKREKEKQEAVQQTFDVISNGVSQIADVYNSFLQTRFQEIEFEKQTVLDRDDAEIESLKRKFDEGHLSRRKYDQQLKVLEEKKAADQKRLADEEAKLKRKQAQVTKDIAIFNATIHLAEAVIAATTAGPGVGLVLAAITAALDAVQLTAIIAQPLPKFHKGRLAQGSSNEELAVIRKDETIFDPTQSKEYAPTFRAIYQNRIKPSVLNDFVNFKLKNDFANNVQNNIDTMKLAYDIAYVLKDQKVIIKNAEQIVEGISKSMPKSDPRKW